MVPDLFSWQRTHLAKTKQNGKFVLRHVDTNWISQQKEHTYSQYSPRSIIEWWIQGIAIMECKAYVAWTMIHWNAQFPHKIHKTSSHRHSWSHDEPSKPYAEIWDNVQTAHEAYRHKTWKRKELVEGKHYFICPFSAKKQRPFKGKSHFVGGRAF